MEDLGMGLAIASVILASGSVIVIPYMFAEWLDYKREKLKAEGKKEKVK